MSRTDRWSQQPDKVLERVRRSRLRQYVARGVPLRRCLICDELFAASGLSKHETRKHAS